MEYSQPLTVVVTSVELPESSTGFWTDESMFDPDRGVPMFSMSETASFFFGRSPLWLRKHANQGHLVLDGEPVEVPRTIGDQRRWRLIDIERTAHALAQGGHIKVVLLVRVIEMVKLVAQNYHYLLPSELETRIQTDHDDGRRAVVAVETLTRITDDLDGKPDAHTRHWSLGGTSYRIDLTDENYQAWLALLQPYITASQPSRVRKPTVPEAIDERRKIRAWANEHGLTVGMRGRIPVAVLRAYERACASGEVE